jgi:hypothetical protein
MKRWTIARVAICVRNGLYRSRADAKLARTIQACPKVPDPDDEKDGEGDAN